MIASGAASADTPSYPDGTIFSNAEDSYFAVEESRGQPADIAVRFADGKMRAINAFGGPAAMPASFDIISHDAEQIVADINGVRTHLRKAREVHCWGGVKRDGPVADGESEWLFAQDITLHDQGGRAQMGGGDSDAPLAVIRIRRVTWAAGSNNRPSMVIYVHETRDDMRAVSYAWADGDASRVGINLRWMQVSCTILGAEREGSAGQ